MKHILFVDDDENVLHGLRDALRRNRRQWSMQFATGAAEALVLLEKQAFDIVVSDMRMPEMDGAALLEEVRRQYPASARIVLSGHSERDQLIRASAVAHQYLSKPCDGRVLQTTLQKILSARDRINDIAVFESVGRLAQLSSVGALQQELLQTAARNGSSEDALCILMEKDNALLLRTIELFAVGFPESDATPGTAHELVDMYGFERVRALALLTRACNDLERHGNGTIEPNSFMRHAAITARLAQELCSAPDSAEIAFVAGVMHDIGQIVLALNEPNVYAQLETLQADTNTPMHQLEEKHLGFDHTTTTELLLECWGLPTPVAQACRQHHNPAISDTDPEAGDASANQAVYEANELTTWLERNDEAPSPQCTPHIADLLNRW